MDALQALATAFRRRAAELVALSQGWLDGSSGLQFARADAARFFLVSLAAVVLLRLLVRAFRQPGRTRVIVPALLRTFPVSRAAMLRHGAVVIAVAGIPFFVVALAEPRMPLTREDARHRGRRIAILLDASSSMLQSLPASRLAKGAPNDAAFFTTVGAARYFVERRMNGDYRDLVSLVEFGDEAYVITPFTSDYQNVLLSMSLIGDWTEFMNFPEQGTVIARAIDQGVSLFRAFDFLDASGNAMVVFSDGMDAEVLQDGRSPLDVLREARRAEIPVFFIRVGRPDAGQGTVPDAVWEAAVARTGGRFYSAADEATIVRAMQDIDRQAPGRIELRQYRTQVPRYAPFAFAAAALWTIAAALRLMAPWFATFP